MKAMVLAAGIGERMRPLTNHTPKPLIKACGKPLLEWHFDALARAKFREVVVNAAYLAEQIVEFCGDGSRWGLDITLSVETEPLETAGGIINALPLLGDEPFLVINGDVFTDHDLRSLRGVLLPPGGAHLVLVPNPPHNPRGDFAFDGMLLEPMETSRPHFTYSGLGVYRPDFFSGFSPGKRPLKPLLDRAIERGLLQGDVHDGFWTDVGTPQRLLDLERHLLQS